MPYNIIIGRDEEDKKKFGDKGAVFIGRSYVKMGQVSSLANNLFLDMIRPHVILLCGKRGSGKSYSISVIAESISQLPKEIKENLSVIIFDTMGVFWTMKYPNERQEKLLEEWNLKPEGVDVDIFTPTGFYEEYKKKGIPTDYKFEIKTSELSSGDWCELLNIKPVETIGLLISRSVENLKGDYSMQDIIEEIRKDKKAEQRTKDAAESMFLTIDKWGLFSEKGTEIKDLIKPGRVSIVDASCYTEVSAGWSIKALVIGLISRKLLRERIGVRKWKS